MVHINNYSIYSCDGYHHFDVRFSSFSFKCWLNLISGEKARSVATPRLESRAHCRVLNLHGGVCNGPQHIVHCGAITKTDQAGTKTFWYDPHLLWMDAGIVRVRSTDNYVDCSRRRFALFKEFNLNIILYIFSLIIKNNLNCITVYEVSFYFIFFTISVKISIDIVFKFISINKVLAVSLSPAKLYWTFSKCILKYCQTSIYFVV